MVIDQIAKMQKEALSDRHRWNGKERTHDVKEVLADQQRKDDEHRVDLRGVPHDFRIE